MLVALRFGFCYKLAEKIPKALTFGTSSKTVGGGYVVK
jgi:hypothetical protein